MIVRFLNNHCHHKMNCQCSATPDRAGDDVTAANNSFQRRKLTELRDDYNVVTGSLGYILSVLFLCLPMT
jgi:hypothetical protein